MVAIIAVESAIAFDFGAISATQVAAGNARHWTQNVGLWSQKVGDAMIEKPTVELRNVAAKPRVCDVILHGPDLCVCICVYMKHDLNDSFMIKL